MGMTFRSHRPVKSLYIGEQHCCIAAIAVMSASHTDVFVPGVPLLVLQIMTLEKQKMAKVFGALPPCGRLYEALGS